MGNFNQGGKSWGNRDNRGGSGGGFRGGFGGQRGFGDRPRPQMHQATCSDCGQQCEVPFRPTGEKPVYCSECFKGSGREGGGRESFQPKREFSEKPRHDERPRANEDLKEQFEKLNAKMDRLLKMLAPIVSQEPKAEKEIKEVNETKVEKTEAAKKPAKKAEKKAVAKKETKKKK